MICTTISCVILVCLASQLSATFQLRLCKFISCSKNYAIS